MSTRTYDCMETLAAQQDYADLYQHWASHYNIYPELEAIATTSSLKNKTIAEIGCGAGRLASQLAEHTQAYYAIERDTRLLSRAAEQYTPHTTSISYLAGSQRYLPLATDSVDVLINSWSIDETRIGHLMKEINRVLTPTGELIIIEEAWGDPERNESDYYNVFKHINPGVTQHDVRSRVERVLTEAYTITPTLLPIETTYTYASLDDAIRAFEFHIHGTLNQSFSPTERSLLELLLAGFTTESGSVELTEQATLAHYQFEP